MSKSRDDMCFMVSLYGTALDTADIVPLLGEVDGFLCAVGQPPSHLSVTARGFGSNPLLFAPAWKRLQKTAAGSVQSAGVLSFVEGGERPVDEWTVTCLILPEREYFHFGASLVTMPDAEQQLVAFTRRALARIRPAYGIGFFRTRGRGPNLYGLGLSYGRHAYTGPASAESLGISRWGYNGIANAVYNDGMLRDVYPYNLLNTRQLEHDIAMDSAGGDRCLRAWIQAEPWRGRLSECQDGLALWTVEPEHLAEIRGALAPSGALFVLRPENMP